MAVISYRFSIHKKLESSNMFQKTVGQLVVTVFFVVEVLFLYMAVSKPVLFV